jgi:hypothetical protein
MKFVVLLVILSYWRWRLGRLEDLTVNVIVVAVRNKGKNEVG